MTFPKVTPGMTQGWQQVWQAELLGPGLEVGEEVFSSLYMTTLLWPSPEESHSGLCFLSSRKQKIL
jgi:hypothetical protein